MANSYNIVTTGWGKNSDELHLSEGLLSIKIDGDTSFAPLGMVGDISFNVKKEYKDFEYGIPKKIVKKKLIKQTASLKFKLNQIESNKLALASGAVVDSTTVPGSTRAIIASKSIQPLECSILVQSTTIDDRDFDLYVRKGIIAPESVDLLFNSGDWNGIEVIIEVVLDEEPLITNFEWPCLNAKATTADGTAAASTITLASATGITEGMDVFTATGKLGRIIDLATLVATLDTPLAATLDDEPIKCLDPDVVNTDDIAFTMEENAA